MTLHDYIRDHFPTLDHLSRGGLMGALGIDPSPEHVGPPTSDLAASVASFQALVEAERAAKGAAA